MGAITQPIGNIIGSGIDAASQAGTNAINYKIAQNNNAMQKQIADENNQMQVEMNRENNQFSHDEAELAYQRDIEQWMRENQYNSPVEQMKRFSEAGINPTLGFLGNAAMPAANSVPSPVATPHGSGITPSMPNFVTPVLEPFKIAETIRNLSEARLSGSQSKQIETTMDEYLANMRETVRGQRIANDVQESFGKSMADAQLQQVIQDTATSKELAAKYIEDGKESEANAELAKSKKRTESTIRKLNRKQAAIFEKELAVFDDKTNAYLEELRTRSQKNRAEAEYSHAQAFTENELREARKDLLSADKKVADATKERLSAEVAHYALVNNLLPQGYDQAEYREALMRQMEADTKSKEFENTWTGRFLRSLAGPASNVGAAGLIALPKLMALP